MPSHWISFNPPLSVYETETNDDKEDINVPWIGVGARKAFIKHLHHRNRRVRASWCLWTAHPSFICLQPSPSHTSHSVDGSREHNYSVMSIIALRIALPTRDAQPLWSWIIWYLNIGDARWKFNPITIASSFNVSVLRWFRNRWGGRSTGCARQEHPIRCNVGWKGTIVNDEVIF